jgi:hypothetical protein
MRPSIVEKLFIIDPELVFRYFSDTRFVKNNEVDRRLIWRVLDKRLLLHHFLHASSHSHDVMPVLPGTITNENTARSGSINKGSQLLFGDE